MQWEVIERAFVGRVTLVLIGDPKQAIYAFRGGDVVTYLRARERADALLTLDTNYRSDAPLVSGCSACSRAPRSATTTSWCARSRRRRQGHRLAGAPVQRPVPAAGRLPRRRSGSAAPGPSRWTTCAPTSPPTSPPTSRPLLASGATYDDDARSGRPGPRRGRHRREPSRRPRLPRRAGRGRRAGRLHRRHRRVRLAGGGRLAVPARGVRAARPCRAGARRGHDDVLRLDRRRAGHRPRPHRRRGRDAARWADHARARGIAAVLEAAYVAGMAARVLAGGAASGTSPMSSTSPSCSTRSRTATASASPHCCSGCVTSATRGPAPRSATAASTATRQRSRS